MLQATTLRAALVELGELIIDLMRAHLETQRRYPLRRGKSALLDTMTATVEQPRATGGRFAGFDASSLSVYIADYAKYVESGRRPGARKVPISALVAWIKSKRVGISRTSRGRFTKRQMTITQLAFAIQNSIYKRGIAGRPFIKLAFEQGQKAFAVWLDEKALDLLTRDLDVAFNLKTS